MKSGGGKIKGGAKERDIAKTLSLWITKNVKDDIFWRSAISGGRSTIQKKKGEINPYQAGDICAVAPEGYDFAKTFFVECKFYKDLKLGNFFLGRSSPLNNFWEIAKTEAASYNKIPLLIAKQNHVPEIIVTVESIWEHVIQYDCNEIHEISINSHGYNNECKIYLLDEFLNKCSFDNLSGLITYK